MPSGSPQPILPVLDLQRGQVVRGVAGQRDRYRPIESCFASSARPAEVARGLVRRFEFQEAYVADLDALAGESFDSGSLREIADEGLRIWLDAGLGSRAAVQRLLESELRDLLARLIVPLESLRDLSLLPGLLDLIGAETAVFSLDLQGGVPVGPFAPARQPSTWQPSTPREIAEQAIAAGFEQLLVLDLAAVGTDQVLTESLCRNLHAGYPRLQLIGGGGVRGTADVERYLHAGCGRVLVASALHDGRLSPEAVKECCGGR